MIRHSLALFGLVLVVSTGVLMFVRRQSPSPAYLVFVSEGGGEDGVYRMYADGSGQQRLTHFPARLFNQATYRQMKPIFTPYSPDKSWLVYARYREGNFDIFKVHQDGTEKQLTHAPSMDISPAWSPDGQWVAFVSNVSGNFDIYKMRANGSNLQRLTNSPANETSPAWLPAVDFPWKSWLNLAVGFILMGVECCRKRRK